MAASCFRCCGCNDDDDQDDDDVDDALFVTNCLIVSSNCTLYFIQALRVLREKRKVVKPKRKMVSRSCS